jgi:tripartite-type tricarboxylate transporter receptor subunit TctC
MGGIRTALWLLGACLFLAAPAHAQRGGEYPNKPIRVIVPFVAGGGTDLLARLVTPKLSELLGQQIVVDNRGGAAGVVGAQIVAKAVPDGYTLGLFDTAFAINPGFAEKLPFDSLKDFAFLAILATSPGMIITSPGTKIRSIQELVAFAKKYPGKLRYASAGVGSSSHLSSEMLKSAAGINFLHIPFKGAGAAVIDVLGGHTDITFVVPGTVKNHLQAGTLIGLAITGNKPSPNAPDVPTFASVGLGAVNPGAFRFMTAPAGVPAAIQSKLIAGLETVMKTPELQTRLADNDFDPTSFLPHPKARGFVENEIRKWEKAVKDSGAKP